MVERRVAELRGFLSCTGAGRQKLFCACYSRESDSSRQCWEIGVCNRSEWIIIRAYTGSLFDTAFLIIMCKKLGTRSAVASLFAKR